MSRAAVAQGLMMQLGAVQMDSESGSEHERQRSDRRTRHLAGCGVQGERHPGQFLGFWFRSQVVSGICHIRRYTEDVRQTVSCSFS